MIAHYPVYRTYISKDGAHETDNVYVRAAVQKAIECTPGLLNELRFIERFLLLEHRGYLSEEERDRSIDFVMRFQQFTGPLMAKGFEDTALYVYNRLLSLNEVGGNPDRFGIALGAFHHLHQAMTLVNIGGRDPHVIGVDSEGRRVTARGARTCAVGIGSFLMFTARHLDVSPTRLQELAAAAAAYKVIQPERVPFISYPYEWSFGELKSAALATLAIQKRALKLGMSLKDASAYNIQFVRGKAMLIDTLSFEIYKEGEPCVAYRQFCQHFLAPLALMALKDVRLSQLLRVYIDGVPLDLASELLPSKTRFNFGLLTHIHLHAGAQKKYSGEEVKSRSGTLRVSRQAMTGLIESLEATIQKLDWTPRGTEWSNYYDITNYSDAAFEPEGSLEIDRLSRWLASRRALPLECDRTQRP